MVRINGQDCEKTGISVSDYLEQENYNVKHIVVEYNLEIIPKERNLVEYLDIKKAGNPNAYNRKPFLKTEVKKIWDVKDSNIYYTVILMLIYTGCRIGELLDLKKENVNLEERYFKIVASKTAAGIRTAPISEKVYPFFEYIYIP